jgi:antitoxin (DNA-binding transcriptional repressor) of toxin-antitoxin stability system
MKTMTVTEAARNFSRVLNDVVEGQEEIVLIRNHRQIVRLIPEPPAQTALEVLGDLYRTLDNETADALLEGIRKSRKFGHGTLKSLKNPWAS